MLYHSRVTILGVVVRCRSMYASTEEEAIGVPHGKILKNVKWFLRPFCSIKWMMLIHERMPQSCSEH